MKEMLSGTGFSESRKESIILTKINMLLALCLRKKIQPRDFLLELYKQSGRDDVETVQLVKEIGEIPDFDLGDRKQYNAASNEVGRLIGPYLKLDIDETLSGLQEQEREKHWVSVGFLSYEIIEDGGILLHIPPKNDMPGLNEIKRSLGLIAGYLVENPAILYVGGSSILLEHGIFKKLGFTLVDSDGSHISSFRMHRQEFIHRFSKYIPK